MLAQPQLAASGPIDPQPPKAAVGAHEAAPLGLQMLLQIERDARRAVTVAELNFLMANETRRLVGARQVFILETSGERFATAAVSSLATIDRRAPLITWIEGQAAAILSSSADAKIVQGRLDAEAGEGGIGRTYPFQEACVAPLRMAGAPDMGAIIAVRDTPFAQADAAMLQRLAETYAHAWDALSRPKRRTSAPSRKTKLGVLTLVLIVGLGFLPMPLTALAPVEVVPLAPAVIAAPIDGAIDKIDVDPNQRVRTGDPLFRYMDVQTQGALEVAQREVAVAEARLRQVSQMAFVDPTAKRELAVARSELRLKRTEHAFATEIHGRTIVRAPRDGVTVFADKRELVGRPVTTGQKIMEVADPAQTQFRLSVMADDALVLKEGARVRIFMDSDPLSPIAATLKRIAPMAKVNDVGAMTFRAEAEMEAKGKSAMPPLGHRGSAQVVGDKVSLAFFLFRRPISSLRQRFGL